MTDKKAVILICVLETALGLKLLLKQDIVLFFCVIITQIFILAAALRFGITYKIAQNKRAKVSGGVLAVIVLACLPPLISHKDEYEISKWSEAGLYLRGPYVPLLLVLGVAIAAAAGSVSLYLRNKNDLT